MVESFANDDSAFESGVGEEHRAQRARAQSRQPVGEWTARVVGEGGMRKDGGLAIAEQGHFSYPGFPFAPDAQRGGFVAGWCGKPLQQ